MADSTASSEVKRNEIRLERLKIEYSVYYAVQEPSDHEEPPVLLLASHGYGQSATSFMRNFALLKSRNVLVVTPQGPNQFYWQRNPPKVGYAWVTRRNKENSISDVIGYFERLYVELRSKLRFDERKVYLLGFSQGSVLSFRIAASGVVPAAGLIACGADIPADVQEKLPEIPKLPVLVVHGKKDESMNISGAQAAEQALRDNGFAVDTQYFDGGHELPEAEVGKIADWIEAQNG